jgi:hypothetical protein
MPGAPSPSAKKGPAPGQGKKTKDEKGKSKGAPSYTPGAPSYTPGAPSHMPGAPSYMPGAPSHMPGAPSYMTGAPTKTPPVTPPAPTKNKKPSSPTQTPTKGNGGLDCDAVRNGTAPTEGPSTKLMSVLNVVMYENANKDEVIKGVYNIMNNYVRYWLLDCPAPAPAPGRRLKGATMINAIMSSTEESGKSTLTRCCGF